MNEQLHYVFDPAGNLAYRTNNTLTENFQVNKLNELTNNNNSGSVTVVGTTTTQNSNVVTVNVTNAAVVYGDATFAATNMPFTTNYTAVASDSLGRRATNTVSVSIAANNALFQYDGNGNLIYDGLRSFTYDDENQLIQVCVTNQWLTQFAYDGKMRRRIRQECASQNGVWVQTNEVYYVYDGNLVIQERDVNNLPTTTYTRGKDLSGSLQGAGGIGGLLARTDNSSLTTPHSFYHSDANGNVTMLINDSQAVVAKYLYDAFGNILSKSGLLADANLYRFSSKEAHPNSGLVYYLYRYYDPNLQRWPNRDPHWEVGFLLLRWGSGGKPGTDLMNLYSYVDNSPLISIDPEGLGIVSWCKHFFHKNKDECKDKIKDKISDKLKEWFTDKVGGASAQEAACDCDWLKNHPFDDTTTEGQWGGKCSLCAAYKCATSATTPAAADNCMKAELIKCLSHIAP